MAGNDSEGMSSNTMLGFGLVLCAVVVIVAVLGTRFLKDAPPPVKPPAAVPIERAVNTSLKYTVGYYQAVLDQDAKKLNLPVPTVAAMAAPLAYFDELPEPRSLKVEKDAVETPHLRIASRVSKEWSMTGDAQRMRVEHILLSITNKTDRPLAYRVDTWMPDSAHCKSKGTLAQNALALKPGETVQRTECLWSKGSTLEIRAVQTMELSDLGYYYVSRLIPTQALLDERYSAGHSPPDKLKPCVFVPWREIRTASEGKNGVRWSDVIDFYGRHNCDEYSFYAAYRRWTAAGHLPAQAAAAAAPPLEPGANSR